MVELPPVFCYRMCELLDPDSLWWTVAYTEMAANTGAFILLDVYDACRVWTLRREMLERIRRLDLPAVIGNEDSASECRRLLDAIEG